MTLEVDRLLRTNDECPLPCVWGFRAGSSESLAVQTFFTRIGWGGAPYDMPEGPVYFTGKDLPGSSSIRFGFFVPGDQVEALSYALTRPEFTGRDEVLSPRSVIETLGAPDQVWVNLGVGLEIEAPLRAPFNVYLYYDDEAALLQYNGVATRLDGQYQMCLVDPNQLPAGDGGGVESVSVYAGSGTWSGNPKKIVRPFGEFGGMMPSGEAVGATPEDLYDRILQEETLCLTTPTAIWLR